MVISFHLTPFLYEKYCYSLILITALAMIAVKPPVVIPDEKMFLISSGNCVRISGTISTLSPNEKLNAKTSVAFLSIFCEAIMRIPAEATVPNIKSVAPPNTGSGIIEKIRPTAGNKPKTIRNAAI